MEKKYALLIDAENADIKYLSNILNELKTYGNVTYKRMYGDFTSSAMKEWNRRALEYAIVPIQQPHYTKYKNAADIMLVIDAMDILYNRSVDGFCIVSNDSDYTRLVNRLCEAGYEVIGMGSSDASKTLKAACTEFKNLEKIFSDDLDTVVTKPAPSKKGKKTAAAYSEEDDDKGTITPIEEIRQAILDLIGKEDDRAGLGGIKSTLQRQYTDFDERNYGFTSIRKFIESMKDFQVIQEDSTVYVTMKSPDIEELEVYQFIRSLLFHKPYEMGDLSNKVHEKFEGFNPKHYGYNQFGKFVSNIDGVVVYRDDNNNAIATLED
ncbi:MAG: NYN domain-containing protein [Lachnospiraceae bacterium]|nr:NYN domain-containing protein [Lachnospiraceae bacterium]